MKIEAHLIECDTLDEAREKAEQLVFVYKSNNPTTATTILLMNNPLRKGRFRSCNEQLLTKQKSQKQMAMRRLKEVLANKPVIITQVTVLPGAKIITDSKETYHFNNRGSGQKGRSSYNGDQRQNYRGRGYGRGHGYE